MPTFCVGISHVMPPIQADLILISYVFIHDCKKFVGLCMNLHISILADDVNGDVSYVQIQRAVSSKMEVNLKLEQDEMEGVDEQEWVSIILMNHNWEWLLVDTSG